MKGKPNIHQDAFFNDLESVVSDIELLIKDYGYDVDECMDDEDECKEKDENIFKVISAYTQLKDVLGEVL